MDITEFLPITSKSTLEKRAPVYPTAVTQQAAIKPLLATLSTANMQSNLETFSEFFNRYYKSSYGAKSSAWLQSQVQSVITASGAKNVTVKAFPHSWGQNSIIATIPSKSSKLVILGSHQDSINLNNPSNGKAPGADDDGSGSVTILEAMRVLLSSPAIASGQAANTIEFHWYSAEEAGLLGSQAIFTSYKNAGKNVVAMMQQDMTGYAQGTTDAGKPEAMGVIVDYVDTSLTSFIKKVITAVSLTTPSLILVPSKHSNRTNSHSCSTAPFPASRPNAAMLAQTTLPPAKQATLRPSSSSRSLARTARTFTARRTRWRR